MSEFYDTKTIVLSKAWMDEFQSEEPSIYIELLENFRFAKKTFKMDEKVKVKKRNYDTTFHNIKIPFTFQDFMSEKASERSDE